MLHPADVQHVSCARGRSGLTDPGAVGDRDADRHASVGGLASRLRPRFFSNARWSVDELGLALACLIVERFTNPGVSVLVAVDAGTSDHPGSSDRVCIYALIA